MKGGSFERRGENKRTIDESVRERKEREEKRERCVSEREPPRKRVQEKEGTA